MLGTTLKEQILFPKGEKTLLEVKLLSFKETNSKLEVETEGVKFRE